MSPGPDKQHRDKLPRHQRPHGKQVRDKPLRNTHFSNQRLDRVGLELLSLKDLRARVAPRLLAEPERLAFFMLMVATGGSGEHLVDFHRLRLKPGTVLLVRPGEIQQWSADSGLSADLLLVAPMVLQPAATSFQHPAMGLLQLAHWPTRFQLNAGAFAAWKALAPMLRSELDRPVLDSVSAALSHELLLCMLLELSRCAADDAEQASHQALLVRRFQRELDSAVAARPSVAQLAAKLRVSTSTLSRSCVQMLGHSAKQAIDRRIALEAQRILVHSGASAAAVGEQLGFSEPTNFLKFFKRRVGMTPESFRKRHRLA